MIFNLFHLIFGCVCFTASGGFAERFINVCTAKGIQLWGIRKKSYGLTACTTIEGYKKIINAARASGMKVRIKKKVGLPFVIRKYESHTGLFVGFFVVLLILSIMSNHIWVVNIHGNTTVDSEKIADVFSDAGLSIGVRKNKFDASDINSDAVLSIGELSWASINIDGSVAEIEVREAMHRPSLEKYYGTSNIVACKDGQVEIIEPYKGAAAVKGGQTVMEGSLLVSGISRVKSGMSVFNDADGYIVARTKINVDVPIENNSVVLKPKTRKIYSFFFLGKEFSVSKKRKADTVYRHKSWLYIHGVRMPFGIFYTQYTDFEEENKSADKELSELSALNDYALKSYNETLHAQIISQMVEIKNGTVKGEYSAFENIGKRVPFETEETPQESAD